MAPRKKKLENFRIDEISVASSPVQEGAQAVLVQEMNAHEPLKVPRATAPSGELPPLLAFLGATLMAFAPILLFVAIHIVWRFWK